MLVDIGYRLANGMFVAGPFDNYDHPDCWWLKCRNGHRMFATNDMIEAGTVTCAECAKESTEYAALKARNKRIDELLDAGRGDEPGFLEENS
jgi:hypothetical protein